MGVVTDEITGESIPIVYNFRTQDLYTSNLRDAITTRISTNVTPVPFTQWRAEQENNFVLLEDMANIVMFSLNNCKEKQRQTKKTLDEIVIRFLKLEEKINAMLSNAIESDQ